MRIIRRHFDTTEVQVNLTIPTDFIEWIEDRYDTFDKYLTLILYNNLLTLYQSPRLRRTFLLSLENFRVIYTKILEKTIT